MVAGARRGVCHALRGAVRDSCEPRDRYRARERITGTAAVQTGAAGGKTRGLSRHRYGTGGQSRAALPLGILERRLLSTPPDCGFPTLWSRMPQKAPILVAWAGGDAVQRLYEKKHDPIRAALDACEAVFPQVDVRAQLQAAYVHDWQGDPYARGAYRYLRVNGGDAREVLRAPVAGTLYFAGEATSSNYAGTVSGALETGEQAGLAAAESLTNHIRIS